MPGLIAARLRVELQKKNWSQRKFAKILGVSEGNVSKWLKGEHEPSGEHLAMINSTLGLEDGWQASEANSLPIPPSKETALSAAVQLDWLVAAKASKFLMASEAKGRAFESRRLHQKETPGNPIRGLFFWGQIALMHPSWARFDFSAKCPVFAWRL